MRPSGNHMNSTRSNHNQSGHYNQYHPPPQMGQWFNNVQRYLENQMMQSGFRGLRPMPSMNRPPMHNMGQMRPFSPPYKQPQQGKRRQNFQEEEERHHNHKRARSNDRPNSDGNDQYVVPCSKGTEQITVSIWEYFLKAKMKDDDLEKKLNLQQVLNSIIKETFPGSRLFIVGSSMTGFATRTSDVDMCLVISDLNIHQKKEAPSILSTILKALRNCSFVQRAQVIRAKVPILKFTDKVSGFECDININNTIGIRNTHLLRYYAHLDWRVRPLMLFIKRWARFHDINDASKKTISSYSLSLMLLHYLQAGVNPPVLPCLQSLKPKLFSSVKDVRQLSLEMEMEEINFTSTNKSTLGELFLGFLHYYSNEFRFDSDIMSIRKGRAITHDDVSYEDSDWKFLCIEEPFEGTNTARSVFDHYVFLRILRVINTSFRTLQRHRHTDSILEVPF